VTGLEAGNAVITATQQGISGSTTVTVTPAVLVSIGINPAEPSLAKGTTQQLTATGVYSDNSTQDLTHVVSWNSVEPRIAIISNVPGQQGLLFGRGVGGSIVRAFMGSVSGSVTATVTAPALSSIVITPPSTSIANGTSQQLVATGTFSDKSTQDLTQSVSWTSSDPTKAVISNAQGSQGLVTATGVGAATITATQDGVSGTAAVTVTVATLMSITITPPNASVAKGTSQQLIATGTFTDQTTQDLTRFVSWTSSDSTIAAVSNAAGSRGLATGTGVGSATITARRAGVRGALR
jgi:trimeric autotransporter adhesin